MQKKEILLLEDDNDLCETIAELLEDEGYSVDAVLSGDAAVDASYEKEYDLYIFDINVPDINGLELLESLRKASDATPAIFISALVDLNSIAKAFSIGAQDYIKKPFFPEELLIRVNAKLQKDIQDDVIVYGDLVYHPRTKELYKNGTRLHLGEVQQCLCHIFLQNIDQVLDKSILLDCLVHPSDSALRVALNKLKQNTQLPIKNIRSVGYVLEAC